MPLLTFVIPLDNGEGLKLKHFWVPVVENLTENFPVFLSLIQICLTMSDILRFFR